MNCLQCPVAGFATELGLKSHQLRLHLNPHRLSDEDRSLAGGRMVDSGDVDGGEGGEGGVYRCHLCLRLCEEKVLVVFLRFRLGDSIL